MSESLINIVADCRQIFNFAKFFTEHTAQKMKFSIKDLFSKCDQIRSFLRVQWHFQVLLLMMEINFLLKLTR